MIGLLGENATYMSIPEKYKVCHCEIYTIGDKLSFSKEYYNVQPYIVSGLSKAEEWGAWTLGNEYLMKFRTESEAESFHGCIDCGAFNNTQTYIIYVNSEKIAEGTATGEKIEFDFDNPGCNAVADLKIELPDAVSPESLGMSSDTRILALGIKSMIFTEN